MVFSFIIGLIIIIGVGFLLKCTTKLIIASRKKNAKILFGLTLAIGLCVGVRFCVYSKYQMNEQVRVQGVPIPLIIFVHEEGRWTDYVKPPFVDRVCMIADMLCPVGLIGLSWLIALKLGLFRQKLNAVESP
jgi:hypothetical protein